MMKNLVSLTLLLLTCFGLLAPPPMMTDEDLIVAKINESRSIIAIYTQQIGKELEKGVAANMNKVEDLRGYRAMAQTTLTAQKQRYQELLSESTM